MSSYLSKEELIRKLGVCSGLIPVELDLNKRELIWRDLGRFHTYEGFFRTSLATFAQLRSLGKPGVIEESFHTDVGVLDSDEILTEYIYPTAFIFHAGRCGSTLLSKSLARSRSNLVFGEADIHNLIWGVFSDSWQSEPVFGEREKRLYKHLILAMGRRRLDTHKNHIIKFTSTNILMVDLIRSVFPDVPTLFIYRTPTAILRSFLKQSPGWANSSSEQLRNFVSGFEAVPQELEFYQRTITRFFSAALDAEKKGIRFLNYDRLTAPNLATILSALKIYAEHEQLKKMQDQFEYDSKSEYKLKPHEKREVLTEMTVTKELDDLYQRLLDSDRNI
jgi:hypothetical protein